MTEIKVKPLPKWAIIWMCVSAVLVIWDFLYVLNRPFSLDFWLWKPYKLYITVDKMYGSDEPWLVAQSIMNIFEVLIQLVAVHLFFKKQHTCATMTAVCAQLMTFWKTVAYFMIDIVSGFAYSGHNDCWTMIKLYLLPNGMWLIFPFIITIIGICNLMCALGCKCCPMKCCGFSCCKDKTEKSKDE